MSVRITHPKNVPEGLRFERGRARAWDKTPPWDTEISNDQELDKVMIIIKQAYEEYKSRYQR